MDFPLRIHVTKMLQGIYISLHSARNLFSGLRPCIFVFKIFQSPPPPPSPSPPPLVKKMEWAVLYPKYILFSFTLNLKLAQRWSSGLGRVNKVWLRILSYFHYSLQWPYNESLNALRVTLHRKTSFPLLRQKKI